MRPRKAASRNAGLRWREEALEQLEEITTYIAADNEAAAFRLRDRIIASVEPARKYPEIFRSGRVPGTREIIAHPNYIVVYAVAGGHIDVVGVLHVRQEYP